MDKAEVVKILRAALEKEPGVDLEHDRIDIDLDGGVATLSGEVADIAAKRLTLEHAAALPAVIGIVDRLHVRPAEHMGDGAIGDHLEHVLANDSAFDQCVIRRRRDGASSVVRTPVAGAGTWWIEIAVGDGVVTLDGDVPSLSHQRLAGVFGWWVPGSRDVVNGLGVEPPEDDSEAEILDALRLVLDKDPFLEATQIHASCKGSVITLHGLVQSEAQKDSAEFDAWALLGVDKVVNEIQILGD
jgi:osmotically-inducible protein OsmY